MKRIPYLDGNGRWRFVRLLPFVLILFVLHSIARGSNSLGLAPRHISTDARGLGSAGSDGFNVERDVGMPMRDGVELRADILRPSGAARFATLVCRTPYDQRGCAANVHDFSEGRGARLCGGGAGRARVVRIGRRASPGATAIWELSDFRIRARCNG